MTYLSIDFETKSAADLKEVGLFKYAKHATTDVWCLAYAFGDEEPKTWIPGQSRPQDVVDFIENGGSVYAWNAPFEYEVWNNVMTSRYNFPTLAPEQTFCTMAMAYAMALPGALGECAAALGLKERKDTDGAAIMMRFCKPWRDDPLQWQDENPSMTVGGVKYTGADALQKLYSYCRQDVVVEREVKRLLMPLSAKERQLWLIDRKINARGVQVDIETAKAAVALADEAKARYNKEMGIATGGKVKTCSSLVAMKEWLKGQGVDADDGLAKQDLADWLATDLPPAVRTVLSLRQEANKASTSKLNKMIDMAGEDGRLRGMYQYHGAGTGRWAGRSVQLHNLPRDMPKPEQVEMILQLVREQHPELIDAVFGPPLATVSRCLRSFFTASEGKVLVGGDYSNVEGRGQAWFAGEQWKIDAYVAADQKRGPGLYELAYSRMFNVPVESVKNPSEERQVGKVAELAFGYQGGVGSFHVMGKTYGVKVSDAKADEFKRAWRAAHPRIAGVWREIQDAAISAVVNPGTAYSCGVAGRQATYKMAGSFLWCLLPSGRVLCYPFPKLLEGEYGPQLTYMVQPDPSAAKKHKIISDPANSPKWARTATYGGSLYNNIIQGTCRDFLGDLLHALDDRGAQIVIHTHDDAVIEVDAAKAEKAREAMQQMMRTPPAWAKGFPLHASCDIMTRYGKG